MKTISVENRQVSPKSSAHNTPALQPSLYLSTHALSSSSISKLETSIRMPPRSSCRPPMQHPSQQMTTMKLNCNTAQYFPTSSISYVHTYTPNQALLPAVLLHTVRSWLHVPDQASSREALPLLGDGVDPLGALLPVLAPPGAPRSSATCASASSRRPRVLFRRASSLAGTPVLPVRISSAHASQERTSPIAANPLTGAWQRMQQAHQMLGRVLSGHKSNLRHLCS